MRKFILLFVMVVIILSLSMVGCAPAGVPQQQYDSLNAQLQDARAQAEKLEGDVAGLEQQNKDVAAELETAKAQVAELQGKIDASKEQPELAGNTPAETVANIVRFYHATHTYSTQDFFVCSDMAADVWNMVDTQGITAWFMIGSLDRAVTEINQCDHAWVLTELSPGSYLALESTGGAVYTRSEKPRYYTGWAFQAPADYKRYQELRNEYNLRVDFHNTLVNRVNTALKVYNDAVAEWNAKYSTNPTSTAAQVFEARMEEINDKWELLKEMTRDQETVISKAQADMESLATRVNY
ncbi:hypothetical protein ACFLV2_02310 [Chloroflexota bacterium]